MNMIGKILQVSRKEELQDRCVIHCRGGVVRAGQQMGKPSFSQSVDRHTQ